MNRRIAPFLSLVALIACAHAPKVTRTEAPEVVGRIVPQSATVPDLAAFGTFGAWSLVLADTGGETLVIDPLSGTVRNRIAFGAGQRHAAIAPDGRHLCIADSPILGGEGKGSIGVYDLLDDRWLWRKLGGLVVVAPYPTKTACAFRISESGKHELRLLDLRTGALLEARPGITGQYSSRSWIYSPDGEWLFVSFTPRSSKKGAPWEHWALRLRDFEAAAHFTARCFDVRGDTLHVRPVDEETVRASTAALPYTIAASDAACAMPAWPRVDEEQVEAFLADGAHVLTQRWIQSKALEALEVSSHSAVWTTRRMEDGRVVAEVGRERLSLVAGDKNKEEAAVAASLDGTHLYLHDGDGLFAWQWQAQSPRKLASISQRLQLMNHHPRYVQPAVSASRSWVATIDSSGAVRRVPHDGGAELPSVRLPVGPNGTEHPVWKLAVDDGGRIAVLVQSEDNLRHMYLSSPENPDQLVRVEAFEASGLTSAELRFVERQGERWLVLLHRYDGITVFHPKTATKHAQFVPEADARELSDLEIDPERGLLTFLRPSGGEGDTTAGRWQLSFPALESPTLLEPTTSPPRQDPNDPYGHLAEPILAPASRFEISEWKKKAGVRIVGGEGAERLTLGLRGGLPFAYSLDGRYFCEGQACEEFRCVGPSTALLPLDACAPSRVQSVQALLVPVAP